MAKPPRRSRAARPVATFEFDLQLRGTLVTRGDLTLTPDATKPHQISRSSSSTTSGFSYDGNGGLKTRGNTDGSGPDKARTSTVYDVEGRVTSIVSGGITVKSVYDYTGARVARSVRGTPTFYFGKQFEVTGNQLTRHFWAGNRSLAALAAGILLPALMCLCVEAREMDRPKSVVNLDVLHGIQVGDSLEALVRKLKGCELRLMPYISEGEPEVSVVARCGVRLTMELAWETQPNRIYRIEVTGGTAAVVERTRIGDDIAKLVESYGDHRVHTGEGSVCVTFSRLRGVSFCLRGEDAERYQNRQGTAMADNSPPLEGHIGRILVFGEADS